MKDKNYSRMIEINTDQSSQDVLIDAARAGQTAVIELLDELIVDYRKSFPDHPGMHWSALDYILDKLKANPINTDVVVCNDEVPN